MLLVLKKSLPFEEEYIHLFSLYLKQMANIGNKENINPEFVELLASHPDPINCFHLLPPKWLNNKQIISAVVHIFNRYMLDISSLELFRSIQIQERLKALEERNQPGKRFDFKEEYCQICQYKIVQQENGISEVFLLRPMILAFPNCSHVYHVSCIESIKRTNPNFNCMKCAQK